jgi:hypothetical protein
MEPTLASAGIERPRQGQEAGIKLGMGAPSVPGSAGGGALPTHTMMGIGLKPSTPAPQAGGDDDNESTVIARAPSDLIEATSDRGKAVEETAEWMTVYDEFLRTKRQCQEPADGLSFEKFQNTLRKNRDALVTRHHCKRVKFSVYIKDGRASLKATPVKE